MEEAWRGEGEEEEEAGGAGRVVVVARPAGGTTFGVHRIRFAFFTPKYHPTLEPGCGCVVKYGLYKGFAFSRYFGMVQMYRPVR